MQSSSSRKILKVGFGLALLIFISMSVISYGYMKKLVETHQEIEQSYQLLQNTILINYLSLGLLACCVLFVYLLLSSAKQSEVEELQACKLELQAIADNAQDFIVRFDSEGRHLFVNQALADATGIPVKNYIGKTHEEIGIGSELWEYWNYHLREVLQSGKPQEIEFDLETVKGLRSFQTRIVPEINKSGEVETLLAITRDITQQKKLEAELVESRKKYETIFKILPIGLAITDELGYLIEVNSGYEKVLGITAKEFKQRKYESEEWVIIRSDGTPLPASECCINLAIKENRIIENVEIGIVKAGKETSWISVTAAPIPLKNYGVAIAFVDITERKQVEDSLRQSEQRFQQLAANVPGMIYRYLLRADGSDEFIYMSPGTRELFELDPEIIQQNSGVMWAMIHPSFVKSLKDCIAISVQTLGPCRWEGKIITLSGQSKWIQKVSRPEKQANGDIIWDGLIVDITERKLVERVLRHSQQQLAAFAKLVEDIANNIPGIVYRLIFQGDGKVSVPFISADAGEIIGIETEELIQNPDKWLECVHPDDRKHNYELFHKSIETLDPIERDYRLVSTTGEVKWIRDYSRFFRMDNSDVVVDGIILDISDAVAVATLREQQANALRCAHDELELQVQQRTAELRKINESLQTEICERKKVEEALRVSEERFRIALKNSPITVFHQDSNLHYTWRYNSVNGCDSDAVIGQTDFEMFNHQEAQHLTEFKQQVLLTKLGKRLEISFTLNGQIVYKDLNIEPLLDQAGKVIGITGVCIDITQERIREKLLQAIFENTLEAIVIADDEGRYVEANPSACKLFGLSLPEFLNKRISDFMEPGFNFELAWRNFLELGEVTGEMRLLRLDGTSVEVSYNSRSNFMPGRHLSVLRDITKRKQAQRALAESEERLRIALEAAHMGTWDWNLNTNKVSWCPNQEVLFGMEIGSFDGNIQTFVASLHPEDREYVLQTKKHTIENGTEYDWEFRIILPNGKIRWLGAKGRVFYDEIGKPVRMIGVNLDISDRKQAEEELIRISKAVESASDAICIGDITGKCIYNNQAFLKLFEYTPDELNASGYTTQLFVDLDVALEVRNTIINGKSWSGEVVLRSRSGSLVLVALRADAIKDQEGKSLGFLAIGTDITASKQAEKALRETQYLLEQIADTTPTILYIYHLIADCNVYANHQCEEFFGLTQPEIQAMGRQFFTEFLDAEDLPNLDQYWNRLITAKNGQVVENELYMKNASGEWRWLQVWEVVFTRTPDGKAEQILGTAVDITERKRLEEMRCALEAEQELRNMQLKFFSMASHEFRTPLSTILLSAQSLAQSYARWPEEKIIRNLQRIQGCTKQMTHLLEDILTINRADTKKLEINPQGCNLELICRDLIQEAQLIYNRKNPVNFVIQGQCQEVCLDEKITKSILDNLLSNAIKYSPPGKNVNLTVFCTQSHAIFQICDEGIGIPPEDLARLFNPFQRGSNVGNISGRGLGLTVVKKCLNLQGGKIDISSELNVGTKVTVTLPLMNCNNG
jgi:PAS domain S-box-containing protein